MVEGILVKGYGGFYYVNIDGIEVECSLRGKFRRKNQNFLPGDTVSVSLQGDDRGVIEDVAPRKNALVRPPIANVDQVVIVMALKEPEPQLSLLDRLLVLAESMDLEAVICFNKEDKIVQEPEIIAIYEKIGYPVVLTSVITMHNIDALTNRLQGKISVFAGLSGVGKSSLLNAIEPNLSLKVGQVSEKAKRGKHTTRYVELISLPEGGMVADTPGFSNLSLGDIPSRYLPFCFPEIEKIQSGCRFSQCMHHKEPDCMVKKAVEQGEIASSRYDNYLIFLEELIGQERRY
ncbi:MAG: ribosome small subunit-dependent GTPase A [Clostridia bacterium]|nr:ribosome small subunit-dependent GTPase A [Clostridia bacterium]